jgi:hypothetical protein
MNSSLIPGLPVILADIWHCDDGPLESVATQCLLDTGSMIAAISDTHPLAQKGTELEKEVELTGFSGQMSRTSKSVLTVTITHSENGSIIVSDLEVNVVPELTFELILPFKVLADFTMKFGPRYCQLINKWNRDHHRFRMLTDDVIRVACPLAIEPFGQAALVGPSPITEVSRVIHYRHDPLICGFFCAPILQKTTY